MDFSPNDLKSLILNPTESLDVEVKPWLDLTIPTDKAKLIKACLALRNNNGGCLVVGFQNDGKPAPGVPKDVRAKYHVDVVQELIARHAFHPFEIKVAFIAREEVIYPVVCVPGGVETPVATKSQLLDSDGKPLIQNDDVYVRSLNSNNRVSSTRARAADWARIAKICLDNREADIGAFIRRHLSGTNIEQLTTLLQPGRRALAPSERACQFLDAGRQRFSDLQKEQGNPFPAAGIREASAVIDGQVPNWSVDQDFLNKLLLTMPHHTGWPPWIDSRRAGKDDTRPYVFDGGWQAYILTELMGISLDFWRIEPSGRFYHLRLLEDDLPHSSAKKPQPGTELDFVLQVSRIAEIVSVASSFAKTMGCDERASSLAFAFRWCGLKGRHLSSWAEPMRMYYSSGASQQNEITTEVIVPLETATSGLTPFIERAVAPVFALFGGMKFDTKVIEDIVSKTLDRRFY